MMITNELLKNANSALHKDILEIFNQIVLTESIPKQWKISTLQIIDKGKHDKELLSNKRGIYLKNSLAKLFEKIITNRFFSNIHITDAQAGAVPERNTIDHLFLFKSIMKNRKLNIYN